VVPVSHPFRKEREKDGAPAHVSQRNRTLCFSGKGGATRPPTRPSEITFVPRLSSALKRDCYSGLACKLRSCFLRRSYSRTRSTLYEKIQRIPYFFDRLLGTLRLLSQTRAQRVPVIPVAHPFSQRTRKRMGHPSQYFLESHVRLSQAFTPVSRTRIPADSVAHCAIRLLLCGRLWFPPRHRGISSSICPCAMSRRRSRNRCAEFLTRCKR
jgi:hypothetical protein